MLEKKIFMILTAVTVLLFASLTCAGEDGNEYFNGAEGIKAATCPPPGFYLRSYNFMYSAGALKDSGGRDIPAGFDVKVTGTAERFLLVTSKKFLGGDLAFDAMLPFIYNDLRVETAGIHEHTASAGDLYFSPCILAYHGERYDSVVSVSFFLPTGAHDDRTPNKAGKRYFTTMATGGFTSYFGEEKSVSLSLLARYEKHGKIRGRDARPGDDLHFEFGLGKTVKKTIDLGIAGYCQRQMTKDRGTDILYDVSVKDRVFAIGPEASFIFPKRMMFLSVRALAEFGARDRSQGNVVVVTLTKRFGRDQKN